MPTISKEKNYYIIFSIFSGLPLFFIPNAWDPIMFDYGFIINDLSGVKAFYKEIGSPFQLFFLYLVYFIKNFTFLSHEFLFDLLTLVVLILFSFEVKKYSEIIFKIESKYSNICGLFAITLPVWHSLVAINLGLYLACYYLALLGYRLFISGKINIKIIGIVIILFSFSQKSNFSFIIGLCLAHNLSLYLNNFSINRKSLFFIIFLSIASYLIDLNFFSPYGVFENYNKIDLKNFLIIDSIKNIYNYLTFFIFYLWVPVLYLIFLKINKKNIKLKKIYQKKNIKNLLVIIVIFASSIAPYILVNKSVDLFFFSDYDSRHAYLLTVSFSLFFTILFKTINDIYYEKKIFLFFLSIFILQSLFILGASYYTKIESAVFRYNFVQDLKKIEEPPPGNVYIINKHIPGALRHYDTGHLFFKAYGKSAWWVVSRSDQDKKPKNFMLERKDYKTRYILNDYNNVCDTTISLTKEIDKYERIFKFYIFNSKKYFKIKDIKSTC